MTIAEHPLENGGTSYLIELTKEEREALNLCPLTPMKGLEITALLTVVLCSDRSKRSVPYIKQ